MAASAEIAEPESRRQSGPMRVVKGGAVLYALGLVLGSRAETGLVRSGEEQASVTAAFDVPPGHPVYGLLETAGIKTVPGEEIMLRRILSRRFTIAGSSVGPSTPQFQERL